MGKKITINGKFFEQRITGVQRYAIELLGELDDLITDTELQIEVFVPENTKINSVYRNIKIARGKFANLFLWEQLELPLHILRCKSIGLNLCNSYPLFTPGIVCVHDVSIKARPDFYSPRFIFWYSLLFWRLSKTKYPIITVSEFSKNEILRFYPNIKTDQIFVVYNSYQHFMRIEADFSILDELELSGGFYLAVSSLSKNKNLKWILEESEINPGETFVIVGGINRKVFSSGEDLASIPQNVLLPGYLSDNKIKALMMHCKAFLFPSLYEGFGLPPLEALSCGAKVITSNTSSMPEILGGSVCYIDPELHEKKLCDFENTICNNSEILLKYSWTKSASSLLDILKKTLLDDMSPKN